MDRPLLELTGRESAVGLLVVAWKAGRAAEWQEERLDALLAALSKAACYGPAAMEALLDRYFEIRG